MLFLLLAFGQKLFTNRFSIDTQSMIQRSDYLYESWFKLERFGLVWMKRLIGVSWYNNALASFLMVVLLGVAAVVWAYLFYGVSADKQTFHPAFFMIPFVASPVMAEQLGFLLQGPEIDISMMLVAVSLMFLVNGMRKKSWWRCALSIFFAAFAFSAYAAMITMFVPAVAMMVLFQCRHQKNMGRKPWVFIGVSAVVCLLAYVMYFGVNKIVMKAMGVNANAYISDQSRWGTDSLRTIMNAIEQHFAQMYKGQGIYYSLLFAILAAVFVAYVLVLALCRKVSPFYLIIAFLVYLSPMLMTVILGSGALVRTEISYPLAFAFVMLFIGDELCGLRVKVGSVFACLLVLVVGLNQGFITNRIFYTESVVYDQDVLLSRSIADRIGELGDGEIPREPVVFEGSHASSCNKDCFSTDQIDLVGRSLFDITFSTQHGTWVKDQFMGAQGFQYSFPTAKQIENADAKAEHLPLWPAKGSVAKEEGYIIVNF